jgi:hypothetical protein
MRTKLAYFNDFHNEDYILTELEKASKEAADPNTKWLSHDEVFGPPRERLGYERPESLSKQED